MVTELANCRGPSIGNLIVTERAAMRCAASSIPKVIGDGSLPRSLVAPPRPNTTHVKYHAGSQSIGDADSRRSGHGFASLVSAAPHSITPDMPSR